MRELVKSKRVEAQLAQAFRRGLDPNDWEHLAYLLLKGEPLPEAYHEHQLMDNWSSWWECHLSGDLLVIYKRRGEKVVVTAVGTHRELFTSRGRKAKVSKPLPPELEEVIERALSKAAREIKRWWSIRH